VRRRLSPAITWFAQAKDGASAIMLAMILPVLIGFGALSIETGAWHTIKQQSQSAADAAAISAAHLIIASRTAVAGDLTAATSEAVAKNGYSGTTPTVVYPYTDTIVRNGVAVILQQTQRGSLAAMLLPGVTIATKAVAVIKVLANACILALSTTLPGVEIRGSFIDALDCAVAANSTSTHAIDIQGYSGLIAAGTLVTTGGLFLNGAPVDPTDAPREISVNSRLLIGAPSVADPYTGILSHAFLSSDIADTPAAAINTWSQETKTIMPGHYKGGMRFEAKAVIDLKPGTYYVTNGDFSVSSGASVSCMTCGDDKGVTIILTSTNAAIASVGNVQISDGARIALRAPSSGRFSGLLFVQDPLATSTNRDKPDSAFAGGPAMNLTGVLYLPSTTVGFRGNPSATCTLLIVNQVTIDGDTHLSISGCSTAGLATLPSIYTVALAE
jgi:Flp pilus assembly protein TadG